MPDVAISNVPCFGNFTIMPNLHYSGMHSSHQQAFNSLIIDKSMLVPPSFRSSALIWSFPVGVIFNALIAIAVSFFIISSIFTLRLWGRWQH